MAGRKVSTVIDEETLRLARELAEEAGLSLSAWLARAARRTVRIEDGLRICREVEAEIGPFSEEALRRADEELDRRGIPRFDE